MPILYNVGNKLTAGSEPPQLYRYQDRVLGDGGTLETRDEASTFIRRLRSAGVLGSTVIAGVAGGYKAGTLYSIIGPDLDVTRGTVKNRVNRAGVLSEVASGVPATDFAGGLLRGTTVEPSAVTLVANSAFAGTIGVGNTPTNWGYANFGGTGTREIKASTKIENANAVTINAGTVDRRSYVSQTITWVNSEYTLQIIVESYSGSGNSQFLLINTRGVTATLNQFTGFNPAGPFPQTITRTFTPTAGSGEIRLGFGTTSADTLATNNDEITISGVDIKLGSFVSSPIIHTGSGVATRNADVITKTGLGSVLPQTEGWVYAEVDVTRFIAGATRPILYFDDGTARRGILLTNLNRLAFRNAEFQITETGKYKVLARHTSGFASFDLFVNGILRTSNSLTATGVNTSIGLGVRQVDNDQFFNDPIHSYAIGSGSITDAQAIQLTTL
jgi:hypothetical protein